MRHKMNRKIDIEENSRNLSDHESIVIIVTAENIAKNKWTSQQDKNNIECNRI
jgi:hypothetical protein